MPEATQQSTIIRWFVSPKKNHGNRTELGKQRPTEASWPKCRSSEMLVQTWAVRTWSQL